MKLLSIVTSSLIMLLLNGCVPHNLKNTSSLFSGGKSVEVTESERLLSCLQETKMYSRTEYKTLYRKAYSSENSEDDDLYLICMDLHYYADYKNFKKGMLSLKKYAEIHQENKKSLLGIASLIERINREKINRWSQRNKLMNEKEELEEENIDLLKNLTMLEENNQQDVKRVEELQKQIEQLKNIENIIKNREL